MPHKTLFKAAAICLIVCSCAVALAQGTGDISSDAPARGGVVEKILGGERRNLQFGPYKWRVLEVRDGKVMLISEDIVEYRAYHSAQETATWATCDLREYLNGDFLQKFTRDERSMIVETAVQNEDNPRRRRAGNNNATNDRVFLLSTKEVRTYFRNDTDRRATVNGTPYWWWLRSSGHIELDAARVEYDGHVNTFGFELYSSPVNGFRVGFGFNVNTTSGGVRPVLWLNLGS